MRSGLLILLLLLTSGFANAAPAPDFGGFAYQQKLGSPLPLQEMFRDETGASVRRGGTTLWSR